MRHAHAPIDVITDMSFFIALLVYMISLGLWVLASAQIQYSVIIPVHALTIVMGGVIGYFVFSEGMSLSKLISYVLITSGVIFLLVGKET
jgi:multidrug transporter EmrE-like cation transporter